MQAHLNNKVRELDIIQALPESVYCKNKEGKYITCSQRMAVLAGCASTDEVIGKTDDDLVWSAYADLFRANDKIVMESKKTHTFEERGVNAFDQLMIVRTIKSPLFDENGEVIGTVGISFDVTDLLLNPNPMLEKIAANVAIQRAESTFLKKWYQEISGQEIDQILSLDEIGNKLKTYMEGIIDKLPANIYWMDLDGYILGCNQQMATVLGYTERNDIISKHTLDFLQAHECEQVLDNNKRAVESSEVIVFEECAKFQGEEKIFLSHKSALCDKDGTPISLVGVSFDITDRKRMERELKLAKEEAEAANLAKIHFMNNMRHDIRTPLSCVVGSARILKAMETDPEKAEFIEGILSSTQNLLQMLTNMLEFNHIQSVEKSVEFKPVKIVKLGQDLIDMLALTAKSKGLQLSSQVSEGAPEVIYSDSYRLQRILLNLINNAIKFTHEGSVSLHLKGQDNHLHISVCDTGIGIDPERKLEVFDKFVRLVDSDKGLYEGEGLGLAIVKQFVHELQGEIELETRQGSGSIFTVKLPIEPAVDLQRM